MPDVIAHMLCAQEAVALLNNSDLEKEMGTRKNLLALGAQGPDIFFYYKAWPWSKKDRISELGELLHGKNSGAFFRESILFLKQEALAPQAYYHLLTYLLGFISHFCLDYLAHPLIFYRGGFSLTQQNSRYGTYHKFYEIALDYLLLLKKRNRKSAFFNRGGALKPRKSYLPALYPCYSQVVKKVYGIVLSKEQLNRALEDTWKILNFLHDPLGIKTPFIKLAERVMGKKDRFSSAINPRRLPFDLDFANQSHQPWHHPCDYSIISRMSFYDLYEKAVKQAAFMMEAVLSYLRGEREFSQIQALFQDIDFSTGMPCGTKMEHFHCIFDGSTA